MALFGLKKNKDKKIEKKASSTKIVVPAIHSHSNINVDIIRRPRITEKSGLMNEKLNVYTFEVQKNSSKSSISRAIKSIYKVNPLKIRTISLPSKKVFIRNKRGVQPAVKKALVYLKKGDKIEFA